jgi:hypothetical protein
MTKVDLKWMGIPGSFSGISSDASAIQRMTGLWLFVQGAEDLVVPWKSTPVNAQGDSTETAWRYSVAGESSEPR